jgi:hypothetical protein
MKQHQVVDAGAAWMCKRDMVGDTAGLEFSVENVVAIRAEWMRVAETIAGNLGAFVNLNRVLHADPLLFAIPAAYRIMRALSQTAAAG